MSERRESHVMQEEDWAAIDKVAAEVGAIYSGNPSWRRLLLLIARGEVVCLKKENAVTRAEFLKISAEVHAAAAEVSEIKKKAIRVSRLSRPRKKKP